MVLDYRILLPYTRAYTCALKYMYMHNGNIFTKVHVILRSGHAVYVQFASQRSESVVSTVCTVLPVDHARCECHHQHDTCLCLITCIQCMVMCSLHTTHACVCVGRRIKEVNVLVYTF